MNRQIDRQNDYLVDRMITGQIDRQMQTAKITGQTVSFLNVGYIFMSKICIKEVYNV